MTFIFRTALLFCLVLGRSFSVETSEAADRPNVILILADDLARGDLARRNGGISRTPNLDRLASASVRFTQAYSASCVCALARAALLTDVTNNTPLANLFVVLARRMGIEIDRFGSSTSESIRGLENA